MTELIAAVFVASLVGSLHCAGMCGGVVALCVGIGDMPGRARWPLHVGYNGGRLVTYAGLGAVSGAIGSAIDLGGDAFGVTRFAAVLAGGAMIVFGVGAILQARGAKLSCLPLPGWIRSIFERGYRFAYNRPPLERATVVGLLTGFLPCGWLYAFVITSAGTGHPGWGAVTMAAFWAGTLPVMVGVGVGLQRLAGPLRRHVPTMTAAVLIVVGLVTVMGRLNVPAYAKTLEAEAAASNSDSCDPSTAADAVRELDSDRMPCCHGQP